MSANWPKPSQHKITATDQRLNEALFHQLPNVTSKPVDVDIIHFSGTAPIDTLSESLLFEDTVCVVVQRPVGAPVVTSSFNSEPSFYGPHEVWLNRVHVISPKLTPIWIFTLDNPDFHEESAKFVNDVLKVCEELCP